MRPEPGASTLANMSAPPRSTVMLPRLAMGAPTEGNVADGSARSPFPTREIPVGPGGGRRLSHALCLARVELPTAVCSHLQMGYGAPLLTRPLGLARALVAIARYAGDAHAARGRSRAARLGLERVGELPEGELVRELTSQLESVEWPHWAPRVGMVTAMGNDISVGVSRLRPPEPPEGISCPLLAARVVSAIRGPVFMRDTAPSLTHLLDLFGGTTPSGTWELWLPVRPGTVRPAAIASIATQATNRKDP
jgi:hypothetical protein